MVERLTDEALMLAYRGGDVRAFEQLIQRHRTPLFNFLLRLTGSRPRAEDLLQETWLKVIRAAAGYEVTARCTTWLYTIARNLVMDSHRRDSHRKAESLDATSADGEEVRPLGEAIAAADPAPDRAANNAAMRPLLERALQALPVEQREVFVLREYQGVPFKEIAEVTGIPENTVKSRMRYALEGLRRQLAAMGVEGDMADEPRPTVGAR